MLDRPYDLLPKAHPRITLLYRIALTIVSILAIYHLIPRLLALPIRYGLGYLLVTLFISFVNLGIYAGIEQLKSQFYQPRYLWTVRSSFTWVMIEIGIAAILSATLFRIYSIFEEGMVVDPFAFGLLFFLISLLALPPIVLYRNFHLRRRKLFYISRINVNEEVKVSSEDGQDTLTFFLKDILYLEAQRKSIIIHCYHRNTYKKYQLQNNLYRLENEFFRLPIVRVHNDYLVNLLSIKALQTHPVETFTVQVQPVNKHLPVGRAFIGLLKRQFSKMQKA
ncbi:MAG: LytTR family DNA-binding domain-containing protein [Cyclobacteriaceae bacterium]